MSPNRGPDQQAFAGFRPLFEDLKDARGEPVSPVLQAAFGQPVAGSAPLERLAVGVAFKELLPADRPLVIGLDDVDRADRGTLELLAYLVRVLLGMTPSAVLFLLSATTTPGEDHPLRALVEGAAGMGMTRQ